MGPQHKDILDKLCRHTHTGTKALPIKTPLMLEEIRFTFKDNVNLSRGPDSAFRRQTCVSQRGNSALLKTGAACP